MKIFEKTKNILSKIFGATIILTILSFIVILIIKLIRGKNTEDFSDVDNFLDTINERIINLKAEKEKVQKEKERIKDFRNNLEINKATREKVVKKYIK